MEARPSRLASEITHRCGPHEVGDASLTSATDEVAIVLALRCRRCRAWRDWSFPLWDLAREPTAAAAAIADEVGGAKDEAEAVHAHAATALARTWSSTDPLALQTCGRFRGDVRATIYWAVRHDGSGRVLQLAEQQPGVLALVAHAAPLEPRTVATGDALARLPLWRDVLSGRPIDSLIELVAELTDHPEADRPRLRWLARRAGARCFPAEVLDVARLPVPPSDLPRRALERARWMEALTMLRPADREMAATVRYVSAHYREVLGCDRRELRRVLWYIRLSGRSPSRGVPLERLVDRAEDFHENWTRRRHSGSLLAELERRHPTLPTPPVVGLVADGVRITPIRTPRELHDEGERMAHCVFSHWPEAVAGEVAVYHAEIGGEHSTVMLARGDGGWSLAEQRGRGNVSVSGGESAAARRWLAHRGAPGEPGAQ